MGLQLKAASPRVDRSTLVSHSHRCRELGGTSAKPLTWGCRVWDCDAANRAKTVSVDDGLRWVRRGEAPPPGGGTGPAPQSAALNSTVTPWNKVATARP